MKDIKSTQVLAWLENSKENSNLSVKPITLDKCNRWSLVDGALSHDTGHFFHIRGVEFHSNYPKWNGLTQPMIDQSEVGILAFLVRRAADGGIQWLFQAKTEPGTINGTQLAPSVQATFSNYLRIHGGRETNFLDLVTNNKNVISDTPHSEQGNRFLWKFNRNTVCALPPESDLVKEDDPLFRWVPSSSLRYLLGLDYVVNTDSRSVITTTEWCLLAEPSKALFRSTYLQKSYAKNPNLACLSLLNKFPNQRKLRWEFSPLDKMKGWAWDNSGLTHEVTGKQAVGFYEVSMTDREVQSWCQPLVVDDRIQDCVLFMRIHENKAEFWVRVAFEVGFGGRREFGPSLQQGANEPRELQSLIEQQDSREILSILQSDEGSRFMKTLVRYRIILLPPREIKNNWNHNILGAWVNLAIMQKLTSKAGITNNELRTMVSVLLSQQFDDAVNDLN